MQKLKVTITQLFLALLLVISTVLIVRDTIHATIVAASEAASELPFATDPTESASTIHSSTAALPTNCRYGVSSWSNNDFNFLQELGIGWALNFSTKFDQNLPDGVEYTPMIRFKPQLDAQGNRTDNYQVDTDKTPPFTDDPGGLGPIIAANPGRLWLIGNEVDRVKVQDDLMPDVYAKAYHDAYYFIKTRDPSAQIAISGLVQVTPGRLQYLDMVWDSYLEKYGSPMPVDVWNMHIYILPEKTTTGSDAAAAVALGTDPAIAILESGNNPAQCSASNVYCYAEHDSMTIFGQQVVAMRQWMKAHGQQNKPLILSEYSLLWPYNTSNPNSCYLQDEYGNCFTPQRVSKFMTDSFDYLETAASTSIGFPADNNRLVQQWLWYTVKDYGTFSSNLLTGTVTLDNYTMRLPGQTFRSEVNGLRPFTTNPFVGQVSYPTGTTITSTGTTSVTISALVYNNGDTITTADVTVNFFSDANKNQQIGTTDIPAGLAGCARDTEQVDVVWNDLSTGLHPYWVEVSGGNTVQGFVIINPEQIFLPVLLR